MEKIVKQIILPNPHSISSLPSLHLPLVLVPLHTLGVSAMENPQKLLMNKISGGRAISCHIHPKHCPSKAWQSFRHTPKSAKVMRSGLMLCKGRTFYYLEKLLENPRQLLYFCNGKSWIVLISSVSKQKKEKRNFYFQNKS